MDTQSTVQKETNQYIKFNIGKQFFGINVLDSREILQSTDITEIPDSPKFIEGIIDLRNEIVPIVSLKRMFNIDELEDGNGINKVIIISVNNILIGLQVTEVEGIMTIETEDMMSAPELIKKYKKDYIKGVVNDEETLVIILDVKAIFSKEEIESLKSVKQ